MGIYVGRLSVGGPAAEALRLYAWSRGVEPLEELGVEGDGVLAGRASACT